jgi:hypothetical protein
VGSEFFSLVHAATVNNLLDFGQVKQRSVYLAFPSPFTRLMAYSLLDNLSKHWLEDMLDCLLCLRPSDTESNAELEALNTELVDQSLEKLEQDSKSGRLRDEDGHAIMGLVSRSKDYDLFKTR